MQFQDLVDRALAVQKKYNDFNEKETVRWTAREYAEGFMADAGTLMKLVQAKTGIRHIDDVDAKLRHELSDCLWSIIVIAKELDLDLEKVFMEEMDTLEARVDRGEG